MKELLLIDEPTVATLLSLEEAMRAVEEGFVAHTSGRGRLFPVVKEKYSDLGSFSLKSGVMTEPHTVGVKAAGSWRGNPARGLPTVQATVVLVDPETGEPIAIIAGKTLTTLRTGAAGGVAARVLAREDARTLAVVGTGVQGEIQVEAALVARPGVEEIRYCSPVAPVPERFKERFSGRARLVPCGSPAEAARGAHIVITGTPSAEPLLDLADVDPGTHVTAVGADAKGKREIGPGLLAAASRFVDSAEQARSIGEHQHAPELAVTEIGTLIEAGGSYRRRPDEITLFDSTGVAFQDLAAARRVYDLAVARGAGRRVPWPT